MQPLAAQYRRMNWTLPYASRRAPLLARHVVATSQPLAAQAGLRMLLAGGNAVDAALAAAITLTVVEPTMNGIGGDLYALVWHEGALHGLDATGAAPMAWTLERFPGRSEMPRTGWDSVTVPGQVSGWAALSARFGRLPFARLFDPAIEYAEHGFPASPVIASVWPQLAALVAGEPGFAAAFLPGGRATATGERWRLPDQARTLADFGQNPQAMIDAPRFMVSPHDGRLKLEAGIAPATAAALVALGHNIEGLPYGHLDFGAAQIVQRGDGHYTAASDGRRDGHAVGF